LLLQRWITRSRRRQHIFYIYRDSKYGEEFATIYFLIFEYGESRERQCSVHNFNGLVDFPDVLYIRPFVREADGLSAMGLIIYIIFFIKKTGGNSTIGHEKI